MADEEADRGEVAGHGGPVEGGVACFVGGVDEGFDEDMVLVVVVGLAWVWWSVRLDERVQEICIGGMLAM